MAIEEGFRSSSTISVEDKGEHQSVVSHYSEPPRTEPRKKVIFCTFRQVLSQEEVQEIREGLKRKWNEINHQYQMMTHVRLIDTTGLKRRKEDYERQLSEIEQDIKKLNKAYIFVE